MRTSESAKVVGDRAISMRTSEGAKVKGDRAISMRTSESAKVMGDRAYLYENFGEREGDGRSGLSL